MIKGAYIVPMGMANTFLLEGEDGLTLIDAGYPGKEAAVFGAIRALGRSLDQLNHLIFTHVHHDHIGSGAAVVPETGSRTYMHPLDILIAESGGPFRLITAAPGLLQRVSCDAAGFSHGQSIVRDAFPPRHRSQRPVKSGPILSQKARKDGPPESFSKS